MSRLDEILDRLARTQTPRGVGDLLAAVARDEGYENLSLARMDGGRFVEFPWIILPAGYLETYLHEGWNRVDPVVQHGRRSRLPFDWEDVARLASMSRAQSRVMSGRRALGVHSGFTVPVHGVGQQCDLIHFSIRHRRSAPDPASRRLLSVVAVQALTRYLELSSHHDADGPATDQRQRWLRRSRIDDLFSGDERTSFVMPLSHLHALVLVEAAARRWRIGLTELGSRIYPQRSSGPFADLESWGFIADVPDDRRWRYHQAPTTLGHAYLARHPGVPALRHSVWLEEVSRSEVPDDLERNGPV